MEQTERIREMEQRMNRASAAVMELSAALGHYQIIDAHPAHTRII